MSDGTSKRPARQIDRFLPSFDFRERHHRWVDMPPDQAMARLRQIRSDEIRFLGLLFKLRTLPARLGGDPDLARRRQGALFDELLAAGFTLLADEPGDVVVGQIGKFWKLRQVETAPVASPDEYAGFSEAGWCKAAMDIRCRPERGGTRMLSETRIQATDPATRRRFALYWTIIKPGSALIRRNWLAAV